ncbi:hypothetical protein LINGRAHAP2_LOCUS36336, partial [Linum grandiflorum]
TTKLIKISKYSNYLIKNHITPFNLVHINKPTNLHQFNKTRHFFLLRIRTSLLYNTFVASQNMKSSNIIAFFLIALLLAVNDGVGAKETTDAATTEKTPKMCLIGPVTIPKCTPEYCVRLCREAYFQDQGDGKCEDKWTCVCYKPCSE